MDSNSQPRKTWRRHWLSGVAGLVLSSAAFAHEGHGHVAATEFDLSAPRRPSPEARKHIGLEVAPAALRSLDEVVWMAGIVRVDPARRAIVAPRAAGLVVEVTKRVGDRVSKGELLARIDSPERARALYDLRKLEVDVSEVRLEIETLAGNVASQQAVRSAAEQRRSAAHAALERALALGAGAVGQGEIETRRSGLGEAEADLAKAEADLTASARRADALRGKLAAIEVSREALASLFNLDVAPDRSDAPNAMIELRAARDGVVATVAAVTGEWVAAGAAFFEIIDLTSVLIEGRIPERELARLGIAAGANARVWLDRFTVGAEPLATGAVAYIGVEIDSVTRTAAIGIAIPDSRDRLRVGQYVEVAVVTGSANRALTVAREAVIEFGSLAFVFVESGDTFMKQDIALGKRDDRFVEILSGLAPNDRVVVRGGFALTQMPPDGAAPAPTADQTDHGH
jgi:membrane fusion protein, heavy metal efflux system